MPERQVKRKVKEMVSKKVNRVITFALTASLVIIMAMLVTGNEVYAKQKVMKSGDFRYTMDQKGSVTIKAYKGKSTKVEIPNAINNHMVRTIGRNAFKNKSFIKKVVLPYGLKTIDKSAFEECYQMKTKLPDGLKTIRRGAFYSCENLGKIKLPASLKSIGDHAFYECGIKTVVIPNKVRKVGEYAFDSAETLKLGKAYKAWNWKSFATDRNVLSLKKIKVNSKNKFFSVKKGVLYDKKKTHLVFANCAADGKVSLPASVRVIDPDALTSCEVTALRLNDGLETISDHAFTEVEGIDTLSVPSTVNFLGRSSLCTSAEKLILETRLLTKNSIRGCLKDSNIKTISVQVGSESSNNKYIKKYKNIFTKKITKSTNKLVFE